MTALLEVRDLGREFVSGEETVAVLQDVNLAIEAGEMVAIVGASGSGKSTLMNILGCLDRPTHGRYLVAGRDTAQLDADDLAALRREYFGFIFQRYQLLNDLSALENVEVPAIYAGRDRAARHERAAALLTRLGLGERLLHRPSQLSGGQQQRVSIARALMNGGLVILADEPTGALDSASGHEVMNILKELHAEGHTVIMVTHDMQVAEHAQRIIEISDGRIVGDTRRGEKPAAAGKAAVPQAAGHNAVDRFLEAFKMALRAMASHRLRTFLTMLGIIIGIAAVVSVVALGQGSRERILKEISAIGTNTIDIYPGRNFGDVRSGGVRTLLPRDAAALAQQPYVDSVTPAVSASVTARYRNVEAAASVSGVGPEYFRVKGAELAQGRAFDAEGVYRQAQEAVIDENTRRMLFADGGDPIGEVIFLGKLPVRIVGIVKQRNMPFGNPDSLNIQIPYTTAMGKLTGQHWLRSITVRVSDDAGMDAAQIAIEKLLTLQHGGQRDFFVSNSSNIRATVEQTTATMTLLVSSIAFISLLVGGVGVMNIMLVSVAERTGEIGVRMAVGARQDDIMRQFLIEAVMVCLVGGVLGILLALGIGALSAALGAAMPMIFSTASMVVAFLCSTLIGVGFGFWPARNAARLDPVVALARE
jgi:macrolide transport system ATP-binding/permease protein